MYTLREVAIKQLFRRLKRYKHGERSERAARSRGEEGILIFTRTERGRLLYDEELSIIRAVAARSCKGQGVTWHDLSLAMQRLDSSNINRRLKERINRGDSRRKIINYLAGLLAEELTQI